MSQNDFPENLIKGRIAETVFELMFREKKDFDVYPLGYEHLVPVVPQFWDEPENIKNEAVIRVINNIKSIPDFLLVKSDKSELFFVEVKYKNWKEIEADEMLKIAKEIDGRWKPAHLFLATSEKFYYDSCNKIIEKQGNINPLQEWLIPMDKQVSYLNLLNRFENKSPKDS